PYTTRFRSERVQRAWEAVVSSGQATVSDHGGCAALLSAEDLPDGLVVADDQGRVITFNRMAARLTGVPADHALGKDFRDVLPLHDRSEEHTSELQSRENLVCRLLLE